MGKHRLALPEGYQIGSFVFRKQLGSGGFAITYLVDDLERGCSVVIKELFPSVIVTRSTQTRVEPHSESLREMWDWAQLRFIEEAETLAECKHPNVLEVYETFKANGTVYMVTRYEEGCDLEQWLKRKPRVNERELKVILQALLSALEQVHARGFLHRDIKPQNIYMARDGKPILIDFGSAREIVTSQSQALTAVLTPGYAPLEQYSTDGNQGPWTDLYALGAVMYRAITGSAPPDAGKRISKKKDPIIRLASAYGAQFSAAFLKDIDSALEKEEQRRPQSAKAWRLKLSKTASREPLNLDQIVRASLRRKGGDLYCTVPIAADLAQNGGDLVFPLGGKDAKVRVPKNTRNGSLLQAATSGLFVAGARFQGNVFVRVSVQRNNGSGSPDPDKIRSALLNVVLPGLGCIQICSVVTCVALLLATCTAYGRAYFVGVGSPGWMLSVSAGLLVHLAIIATGWFGQKQYAGVRVYPDSAPQWAFLIGLFGVPGFFVAMGDGAGQLKVVDNIKFRWCPPGSYYTTRVGESDAATLREVKISQGFWIAETELTRAQWKEVMPLRESKEWHAPDHPVADISWHDAVQWCDAQNRRLKLSPWRFDLPTEDQWEYAFRAASQTVDQQHGPEFVHGNFELTGSDGSTLKRVGHPKYVNAWNIYDMRGNVGEWCRTKAEYRAGFSEQRIIRGGSYLDSEEYCRATSRYPDSPERKMPSLGFRPILTRDREND